MSPHSDRLGSGKPLVLPHELALHSRIAFPILYPTAQSFGHTACGTNDYPARRRTMQSTITLARRTSRWVTPKHSNRNNVSLELPMAGPFPQVRSSYIIGFCYAFFFSRLHFGIYK
jgi:hypothetical protein